MSRGALTRGMHVQPKEEVQQDVIEQVTEAMQWQREAAAEADLTMHEFHELNTTYQEAALSDMVQEIGDKMGVDAGQVLSTAVMFTDRTRADAERVGMEHDEYLGAICEVRPSPPLRCWNDALTGSRVSHGEARRVHVTVVACKPSPRAPCGHARAAGLYRRPPRCAGLKPWRRRANRTCLIALWRCW